MAADPVINVFDVKQSEITDLCIIYYQFKYIFKYSTYINCLYIFKYIFCTPLKNMSTLCFYILLHHTYSGKRCHHSPATTDFLLMPRPGGPSSVPNPLAGANCGSQRRQPGLHHEIRHSSLMCQLQNSKILCMFSSAASQSTTFNNIHPEKDVFIRIPLKLILKFVDFSVGNQHQNASSANPGMSCGHPSMRQPSRRRAWPEAVSPLAAPN